MADEFELFIFSENSGREESGLLVSTQRAAHDEASLCGRRLRVGLRERGCQYCAGDQYTEKPQASVQVPSPHMPYQIW